MSERSEAFSTTMDRTFAAVADKVGNGYRQRLLCERRLASGDTANLRAAAAGYMAACLGYRGDPADEPALLAEYARNKTKLANRTPNGVLMPKREHTVEFNRLHKAVATVLGEALPDALVDGVQTLMMYRVAEGESDTRRDERPYATNKIHSDVWAGDPIDSVTVILPVLGHPERVSIEFLEMPRTVEHEWMRPLEDYSEASVIQPLKRYEELEFRIGSMYLFDSRLLHQTMRKGEGFRISLDFRFRRRLTAADQVALDGLPVPPPDRNPYIPYTTWKAVGTEALLVAPESCAEAQARFAATPAVMRTGYPQVVWLKETVPAIE